MTNTSVCRASTLAGHVLAVTFVAVSELTMWTLVRRWGPRNLATMRTFLSGFVALPYAQLRGRPRPSNDSWIAAYCLVRELPLAPRARR